VFLLLAAAAAAAACGKATDESEMHGWQEDPPPADKPVEVPAALSIGVTIDHLPKPTITADTLRAAVPDFADAERRAWRISKLIGDSGSDVIVEAVTPTGLTLKFPKPIPTLEPVLYLTRRGEVVVAALDPNNPFPGYHGHGGRLHRAGDSIPRLAPVARLDVTHAAP
jgi:hypothetical protein